MEAVAASVESVAASGSPSPSASTSPAPSPAPRSRRRKTSGAWGSSDRTATSFSSLEAQRRAIVSLLQGQGADGTLNDRIAFAELMGVTFDGLRDTWKSLGYKKRLSFNDYAQRYERGGIAEQIVEAFPSAMWGSGGDIVEDPDPAITSTFETSTRQIFARLDIWSELYRADVLARIGRFSILVIGAIDKKNLGFTEQPLQSVANSDQIGYVVAYGEDRVKIAAVEEDATSPRLGLPLYYTVKVSKDVNLKVHFTRVVHVAERRLRDRIYGTPALRAVWNLLDDLDKVRSGGAEAAWKRADPGLQIDLDPEAELEPGAEDDLSLQIDDYQNGLRRVLQTRGATITPLTTNPAVFAANSSAIIEEIAGTSRIPQRLLLGSERGELASTQDRASWNRRVVERSARFGEPIVRDLVDRLILTGAVPAPVKPYTVQWPSIDDQNESERAEVALKLAQANYNQFRAQGTVVMMSSEIRSRIYDLDPIEQAELDAEAKVKPPVTADGPNDPNAPGGPNDPGDKGKTGVKPKSKGRGKAKDKQQDPDENKHSTDEDVVDSAPGGTG